MLLDRGSKNLVTDITHHVFYRYTRMLFRIAAAPAIFQRTMDIILQEIPYNICCIDKILFTDSNDQKHLTNLEEVLRRLQFHGITLKQDKCEFVCDSVEYLGHVVDREGLYALPLIRSMPL